MDVGLSQDLSIEQLRQLGVAIDNSPSPLTLYDKNYNIIYANKTSQNLWPELHAQLAKGLGLEKAAYEAARVLFPEAPDNVVNAAADYAIFTFVTPGDHEMMAPNGRWLKLNHQDIGNGVIAGTGFDITDFKHKEKDLKRAKTAQSKLIQDLKYGLLVIDDDGLITLFNPAYQDYCRSLGFEVYFGMHTKELTQSFVDAKAIDIEIEDFNIWFKEFYETRFGTDKGLVEEFSLRDGRHILRHQNYRKLVGNIITITDITEIKNAQLNAEAAERSKAEFLANMSHEIRTPMNGVMGMAQLLERRDLGEEEDHYVQIIRRSSKALLTIINDILDFSKLEAGGVVLENAPFNLQDCLEDVMALLSMAAAEKHVDLLFNLQEGLPLSYEGDAGRLRQVITNIIGNAVKFTDQGHVLIDVKGQQIGSETQLNISIEDTGIGIPPEKIDSIFNKFQQADGSTTRAYEGTGLGLTIAQRLIKLMGGNITVTSEFGKGSQFNIDITLPVVAQQRQTELDISTIANSKILIVDDNLTHCNLLRQQLSDWNCKSATVHSAKQAIKALELAKTKNITFDLIILDYQMPEETGDVCLDKIQAHNDFKDIPIVMMASIIETGIVKRLQTQGLNAYLTKPFSSEKLHKTINSVLIDSVKTRSKSQAKIINLGTQALNQVAISHLDSETQDILTRQSPSSKIDILIAEDNEINAVLLEYVLSELGVSFKRVGDGQEAVEQFTLLSPKFIFMDISMPIMNGYETTQKIRALESQNSLKATPIVALTAHALRGVKRRCIEAGMNDYITKPLALESIRRVLEEYNILQSNALKTSIA